MPSLEDFREVLKRLMTGQPNTSVDYKDWQLQLCGAEHPLVASLGGHHPLAGLLACPSTTFILATAKQGRDQRSSTASTPRSKGSLSDDSLEGSPMKLQEFGLSNPKSPLEKEQKQLQICPMSLLQARQLVSQYNLAAPQCGEDPPPPMLAFCNGTPSQQQMVAALGSRLVAHGNKHLRLTKVAIAKMPGKQNVSPKKLQRMVRHLNLAEAKQTECCALYDVYHAVPGLMAAGSHHQGSLQVEVRWQRLGQLLERPPTNSQALLKAVVGPGDPCSAINSLFDELMTLKGFARGLDDAEISWEVPEDGCPVFDSIRKLLEEVQRGEQLEVKPEENDDYSHMLRGMFLLPYQEMDFTEQLWLSLKGCSSYQELVENVHYVLSCLISGKLQPMLHEHNKCRLATMIHDSYTGKLEMPDLKNSRLPLELLVGIGIQKLQGEYANNLIGKELVTPGHLDHYVKTDESSSLQQRLVLVDKLHHVLELVAMLQQYLGLPQMLLSRAARLALKHYESHDTAEDHTFSIPVPAANLKNMFDNKLHTIPKMWTAVIDHIDQGEKVTTRCHFTAEPPLAYVDMPDQDAGEKETSKPVFMSVISESVSPLI